MANKEQPPPQVTVSVNLDLYSSFQFPVTDTEKGMTVENLKRKIFETTTIPIEHQIVCYKNKQIDDEKILTNVFHKNNHNFVVKYKAPIALLGACVTSKGGSLTSVPSSEKEFYKFEILTMENRYLQMKHGKDTSHCLKKFNVTHDNTNALIHKKRNQFTELNEPGFSSVQFILQVLILFDKSLEFILKSVLTPEQTNRVQKIQQNIVNVLLTSNFQSTDLKMFSNLSNQHQATPALNRNNEYIPWMPMYSSKTKGSKAYVPMYNPYVEFLYALGIGTKPEKKPEIDEQDSDELFTEHKSEFDELRKMEEQLFGDYEIYKYQNKNYTDEWINFEYHDPAFALNLRQSLQKEIIHGLQICVMDNPDVLVSHVIHDTLEYLKANLFYHNIGLSLQILELSHNQNSIVLSQKIDEQTTISTTNTSRLDNAKNNAAFFQSVTDFFIYMSSSSTEKDKDAETLKKNEIIKSLNIELMIGEEERADCTLRILTKLAKIFTENQQSLTFEDVFEFNYITSLWYYLVPLRRASNVLAIQDGIAQIEHQMKIFAQSQPLKILDRFLERQQSEIYNIEITTDSQNDIIHQNFQNADFKSEVALLRHVVKLHHTMTTENFNKMLTRVILSTAKTRRDSPRLKPSGRPTYRRAAREISRAACAFNEGTHRGY